MDITQRVFLTSKMKLASLLEGSQTRKLLMWLADSIILHVYKNKEKSILGVMERVEHWVMEIGIKLIYLKKLMVSRIS